MQSQSRRLLLGALILLVGIIAFGATRWWKAAPRQKAADLHVEVERTERGQTLRLLALSPGTLSDDELAKIAPGLEARCRSFAPHALVFVGTLFPQGVSSADDEQWTSRLFVPFGGSCLSRLQIFAVMGPGDYAGNPGAQLGYSAKNFRRWAMPSRNYVARFGTLLQLSAIDSNFWDFCFAKDYCTVDFLNWTLEGAGRADARWRMVVSSQTTVQSAKRISSWLDSVVCSNADLHLTIESDRAENSGCSTKYLALRQSNGQKTGGQPRSLKLEALEMEFDEDEFTYRRLHVAPGKAVEIIHEEKRKLPTNN